MLQSLGAGGSIWGKGPCGWRQTDVSWCEYWLQFQLFGQANPRMSQMRWESLGGLVLLDFDELLRRVRGGLAGADAADVLDDAGDIVVEFHHLLVVAPALVGGARLDGLAHEYVDLPQPALVVAQQEERVVLDQEAHVGRVLLGLPQRAVETLRALAASPTRPPHPRLAGRRLRAPRGRDLVVSLGLGGKVVKLAFLFYFYHPQLYSQSIIGLHTINTR